MDERELERREWLGVVGAALIVAAGLGLAWPPAFGQANGLACAAPFEKLEPKGIDAAGTRHECNARR